ncbi:TPA_asm: hypothetical protein G1N77_19390 [Salmonella enterica subsp. enterica serovar Typhimurium]|uniref:Uncharacterized protein n=8 Tax=Salmonella TaxID=590 RepID=A0A715T8Y0_SALTM|nr:MULTISPECIES: hypothetical protein [Salmonella]ASG90707.1 hypothetical protein LFZ47_24945 [Salmonella enterica subsp. salamae serovar 55:k:z39 str. 1315K]AXC88470.1 hypothetical protein DOE57_24930 [Salmonella enterica subsp. salamae serovar 56:b:[1,5]]EAA0921469.1 hypothetical protein [Salmonella enterica subsp. enterica serovar Enteritidis]EAA4513071.1 hypothetical protein [Salmonella enterica subsp. enterica serovar Vitkin]EAA5549894.1 hypothetical protein [Salmonella enterica subsp. en
MDVSVLSILELECGNFDNALNKIITHANSGEHEYLELLAIIYKHGIGIERNDAEYQRICELINKKQRPVH